MSPTWSRASRQRCCLAFPMYFQRFALSSISSPVPSLAFILALGLALRLSRLPFGTSWAPLGLLAWGRVGVPWAPFWIEAAPSRLPWPHLHHHEANLSTSAHAWALTKAPCAQHEPNLDLQRLPNSVFCSVCVNISNDLHFPHFPIPCPLWLHFDSYGFPFKIVLAFLWDILRSSWAPLSLILGPWFGSLGPLGRPWASSWGLFASMLAHRGSLGSHLGPLRPIWLLSGLFEAPFGTIWGIIFGAFRSLGLTNCFQMRLCTCSNKIMSSASTLLSRLLHKYTTRRTPHTAHHKLHTIRHTPQPTHHTTYTHDIPNITLPPPHPTQKHSTPHITNHTSHNQHSTPNIPDRTSHTTHPTQNQARRNAQVPVEYNKEISRKNAC